MKASTSFVLAATAVIMASLTPSADAFGCKPTQVKGWMAACDRVTTSTKAKCDDKLCHVALHRLVEQETIDCYVASGLGPASDLVKYLAIDNFCHGEGPDPSPISTPGPAPTTPTTTSPAPAPTTKAPTPTTSAPGPGPAPSTPATTAPGPVPTTTVPAVTPAPKPAC